MDTVITQPAPTYTFLHIVQVLAVFAVITPVAVALAMAAQRRSEAMLARWLTENKLRLIQKRRCSKLFLFFYGPNANSGQSVFRIQTENEKGEQLNGWLVCGAPCFGLFRDEVEFVPEK